jgi:hypothetical protein
MARRQSLITQSDVTRIVKGAIAGGLTVMRIVARPDGVAIETVTADGSTWNGNLEIPEKGEISTKRRPVL